MEKIRCNWCGNDTLYQKYHDEEWGEPVTDDAKLFEFIILESFQAGLSWITILRKRDNFRLAFDGFDYKKIALYQEDKVSELLANKGIIRHKLKIKAAISNALAFMEIQKEFASFSNYIWSFVNYEPRINHWEFLSEIPSKTELSDRISKDLKKRGFKFMGSTIVYAHLQATGIINDHLLSCWKRTN